MVIQNYHPEKPFNALFKECYYIHLEKGSRFHSIPVIDDCCYDLVFFKEAKGALCYGPKATVLPIHHQVFTIHDLQPPYRIEVEDELTFFTIKVQPWANGHFFSELNGTGILDIENEKLGNLWKALFEASSLAERFQLAEGFMASHSVETSPSMSLAREICDYVYEHQGKVSVSEVSHRFGRSRQYLGKVFRKEVLYPLKKFIITVRILDLVKYKASNPEISLTELGYLYGYFDQPHFINDFKKVCGVQPLHFFNKLPEFMLRHV
ncbi:helix-turn-helix domain-containing protein [Algoriphagus sp. CAU 1675]|uniref:helix-turn-helix domain-containing protein n=1 Tax=Algoriphagus sp. CAU 1675 TaxID=3032597 RepID=UPI0023DBAB41|nr:helix-turn-helix domain-containing protein [Algoriphagus sp. CAU 1675]MDF2156692.1 helix-turn-helix domain-containing protein [Algoriphagus sp. CAU 1675]